MGGVKIALTPLGKPEAESVNAPVKPPLTEDWIGTRTLPFRTSDAVAPAVMLNPLTTTGTETDALEPPPVPVTVMVKLPAAVVPAARRVMVTLPPRAIDGEEKVTVTPAGREPADSAAPELNPGPGVIPMTEVAIVPGATLRLDGADAMVNDDGETIVTPIVTLLVKLPLVPVTVIK